MRVLRHRSWVGVVGAFAVGVLVAVVPGGAAQSGGEFGALPAPVRLLDSRPGAPTVDGAFAGIGLRPAGSTLQLDVAGRAGLPADAASVVLNVTVVDALGWGYLTLHPSGTGRPNASNLNYDTGQTIANTVITPVGSDGDVSIYTYGATHLLVDAAGYLPPDTFDALPAAARLLDTRPGTATVDGAFAGIGRRAAGSTVQLDVAGRAGIPADASAVVLNVTAAVPEGWGFLTVHPSGTGRPNASNLNYDTGQTIANTVVTALGADGRVSIYSSASTHLIVDVAGHLPADTFTPLPRPARLLDSRIGAATIDGQYSGIGLRPTSGTVQVPVAGRAGLPADASTVVLNVTAVDALGWGFVTEYPTGAGRPNASNLNYTDGTTIANTVVARLGAGGDVCVYTYGATHLIVDVIGHLPGPPPPPTGPTCPPLPGEPVDWLSAGRVAHVAGVAVGETFVIRTLPGAGEPVAAFLPPLTELVFTGNGRDVDQGSFAITWAEVDAGSATGWISLWSLVYLGGPRDVTADAVSAFGGLPTAPTMLELGDIVMAELEPLGSGATLVRVTEPGTGPVSEVVYDFFPGEEEGDDAAIGVRYLLVGRHVPAAGGSHLYELVSAEASTLCTRGVDQLTGWCV